MGVTDVEPVKEEEKEKAHAAQMAEAAERAAIEERNRLLELAREVAQQVIERVSDETGINYY